MASSKRCRGLGPALTQGMEVLGAEQTAFNAEAAAIEAVVRWKVQKLEAFGSRHTVVHSDSTSAIAGVRHTGAGPGQRVAVHILTCFRSCTWIAG